ncbi:Uncharacterised protein [Klebsiella pneumoniae]|uniref:Uncharacterized protein n=1 Tax=Klebsiella pneumoniae TaxID=573 RepID=A0A2X3EY77_KLEPN|nr:Uncharacterised protein [Klebsiella pneumoniae]
MVRSSILSLERSIETNAENGGGVYLYYPTLSRDGEAMVTLTVICEA